MTMIGVVTLIKADMVPGLFPDFHAISEEQFWELIDVSAVIDLHDLGVLPESKAWPSLTCQAACSITSSHDGRLYPPFVRRLGASALV
jgi:hypothetical protein